MKMEVLKVSQQMMSESIKMALLRWTIESFHQINYSLIVSNVLITKNVVQLIQASKEVFVDHVFITVKSGKPRTPKIFWEWLLLC